MGKYNLRKGGIGYENLLKEEHGRKVFPFAA
jgi:hypothetical protein